MVGGGNNDLICSLSLLHLKRKKKSEGEAQTEMSFSGMVLHDS